jgi:hypothetical protein
MLNIISQNQTLITILNRSNHDKLVIFPSYECQTTDNKNSFNPILSFGFNLKTFENVHLLRQMESILQRIIKRAHIIIIN